MFRRTFFGWRSRRAQWTLRLVWSWPRRVKSWMMSSSQMSLVGIFSIFSHFYSLVLVNIFVSRKQKVWWVLASPRRQNSAERLDQIQRLWNLTTELQSTENLKYCFPGGLDVRGNMTGLESVHTTHEEHEIMFHVSTLLPFSQDDKQQVINKDILQFSLSLIHL